MPSLRFTTSDLPAILFVKSIAEVVLLGVVVLGFYFGQFNPHLRGSLDEANPVRVAGWVVDKSDPAQRVPVQVFIDGAFVAAGVADQFRPDVRNAGRSDDDYHGFVITLPALPPGEHEARVYASASSSNEAARSLQLIGKPLVFTVHR